MGTIVAMHSGGLHHSLTLQPDYDLSSDHEYTDHPVHARDDGDYSHVGSAETLRCSPSGELSRDVGTYHISASNGPHQYASDRTLAQALHYNPCPTTRQDAHSSPISASPVSVASSSVAYTGLPPNNYTSLSNLSQVQNTTVPLPHAYHHNNAVVDYHHHPGIDGSGPLSHISRQPADIEQLSPCSTIDLRSTYTHNTSLGLPIYLPFTSPNLPGGFHATPRLSLAPSHHFTPYLTISDHNRMASSLAPAHTQNTNECHSFPWNSPEVLCDQDLTCEGAVVTPEVCARMEKGFFVSEQDDVTWTCYRRNYFSVSSSFELHPHVPNGRLYLRGRQVQALGMRLSAAVDGPGGKVIELVQYTPKRSVNDKSSIDIQKVSPTPPRADRGVEQSLTPHTVYSPTFHHTGSFSSPLLPLQNVVDNPTHPTSSGPSSPRQTSAEYPYGTVPAAQVPVPGRNTHHTFERIQFKTATANNGKRRASQQYYHLIMELSADIRPSGSPTPQWRKIATRTSDRLVVRGRSPSHYKEDGRAGRGGNAPGPPAPGYGAGISYTGLPRTGYASVSTPGGGPGNVGAFRPSEGYDIKTSPIDSSDSNTPQSVQGVDLKHPIELKSAMGEDNTMQQSDGYQYHPATLYESFPGSVKMESDMSSFGLSQAQDRRQYTIREDYPNATPGHSWPLEGLPRFRAVDHSRGYYPIGL